MRCYHCMQFLENRVPFCPYCGENPADQNLVHRLPCGTVLNNKYTIGITIGEGGFGITYVGFDEILKIKVAIKEYFPSGIATRNSNSTEVITLSADRQTAFFQHGKERFLEEARNIARFSEEEGIVNVREYFEENGTAYIVMEYLDGMDLSHYINKYGRMDIRETLDMMLPLMRTLEKMHKKGIIHRDIAPDNIMRLHTGGLKLMDFGSAKYFISGESKTMSVMLKQGYSPLEQYSSKGGQGPWTDVYSLCATIYKCITKKTPPNSLDRNIEDDIMLPSALGVVLPPALETVLMKGLAVHATDRLRDMKTLIQAFESVLYRIDNQECIATNRSTTGDEDSKTVIAYDVDDDRTKEPNKRKQKRIIRFAAIVVASLAGIGILVFVLQWIIPKADPQPQTELPTQAEPQTQLSSVALTSALSTSPTQMPATDSEDWTYLQNKGSMTIGITYFEPMNFKLEDGTLTGFETEFAEAVCAELGLKAEFQEIDWESKDIELKSKTIDCIWNGMVITPERKENMDISIPYMETKQVMVCKAGNAERFARSVDGASVVAEIASAGEDVVKEDDFFKAARYQSVYSLTAALQEVKAGTADIAVIDGIMSAVYLKEGSDYAALSVVEGKSFAPEQYGIALRKNSPTTLAKLNEAIQKVAADGKLAEIADKYGLTELLLVK